MTSHQRTGVRSNPEAGNHFETISQAYLEKILERRLQKSIKIEIGISMVKKNHSFDLGDEVTIIECKSHRWTSGNYVPSAKLATWNEAMFYFSLAPKTLQKIFFVERHYNQKRKKTLAEYYANAYRHLIPNDVEIWEYDTTTDSHKKVI